MATHHIKSRLTGIILCGGQGRRMGGLAESIPKPMVDVAGHPLLWHIMTHLSRYAVRDFVLATGHLSDVIDEYFGSLSADPGEVAPGGTGERPVKATDDESLIWSVRCIKTPESVGTAARLREAARWVQQWPIVLSYGDIVCRVNVEELLHEHRKLGKLATVLVVNPRSEFGEVTLQPDGVVASFDEKPILKDRLVNGGLFILERDAIYNYVRQDYAGMFEHEPISRLVGDRQIAGFTYQGFWRSVDTPKDVESLADLREMYVEQERSGSS